MTDDLELLRQYACERSESAFTELVRRHVNLVYSAALRELGGDTGAAEDTAQAVFLELARKARQLAGHPALAGWLYTSVRHVAANRRRSDSRRLHREGEAHLMRELGGDPPPEILWQTVRPVLDDAMHALAEADRMAVVLRFFEDRSLREVGEALGLNENAARMRVDRALDKLRVLLEQRGITSTASGLAAALAAGVVVEAPSALGASIVAAALAAAPAAASAPVTILNLMSMTKLKTGLIGALVVAGVAVPTWQEMRVQELASANARLAAEAAEIPVLKAQLVAAKQSAPAAASNEVTQLRSERDRMKLELARLRNMAGVARRAEADAAQLRMDLARQKMEAGTNQFSGPMGDLMKTTLEQQAKGQLARMRAKVNLSATQSEAIGRILERQMQQASSAMATVFSGKLASADMDEMRQANFNPEQEIQALLSPEQQSLYKEYKRDEAASNARLAANGELMQLQALGLSQEQEDQAFGILYEQTLRQILGEGPSPKSGSPADVLQAVAEEKAKALAGVLSPEQLQAYRQQQETQLKFIKSVLPQKTN